MLLSSDHVGKGDDALGRGIAIGFVKAFKEMRDELWRLVLLNGAVKLAVEGSEALPYLQELNREGVGILVCGRCLETYPQVLNIQLTELYHFRNRIMKESDLVIPEGGIIDLAPLLVEYFILEIPINPVCTPDCRGLCPECGANLNVETCVHVTEPG